MGKRRLLWTPELIARLIAEGRGRGEGYDYIPWLKIQNVPSLGRVHRIKGWGHGRVHHLLSDLEANYFYTFQWSLEIKDTREQYPLLPLEETLAIAERIGVRHPTDPRTRHPVVMTTDFFLTVRNALRVTYEPHTVKYENDLKKPRTLEKLEIERLFWKARNLDLIIDRETTLPKDLCENVKWVHPYFRLGDLYPLSEEQINEIAFTMTRMLLRGDGTPLRHLTAACDELLGLRTGESLAVARHLLANRWWSVDMAKRIRQGEPLILLKAPTAALYGEKRRIAWN